MSHFRCRSRSARPARPARGASYLLLVLVGAIAASAVFGVTSLAGARTYSETVARDTETARAQSAAALTELARTLAEDPYAPWRTVDAHEPTRICLTDNSLVPAGQRWDLARCGAHWDYDPGDTPDPVVRIRWDADDARLHLRALSSHGMASQVGYQRTLDLPAAAEAAVGTADDLDLGRIWRGHATPSALDHIRADGATLIAGGALTGDQPLPALDGDGAGTFLVARNIAGTVATAAASDQLFTDNAGDHTYGDWPTPASFGTLTARTGDLARFGCPDGPAPRILHADDTGNPHDQTTYLCVAPGRQIVDISGQEHTVAPDATAVRVTIEDAELHRTTGAVHLSWSTADLDPVDCTQGCNLDQVSQLALDDGLHPASNAPWTDPIAVHPPSTGVVATTRPTWLGACLGGSTRPLQPGERCTDLHLHHPLTIVAGTLTRPADLHLASSIDTDAPLGLVATGDIVAGHYARPPGGTLTVRAAGIALGHTTGDHGTRSTIRTLPVEVCKPGQPDPSGGAWTSDRCHLNRASTWAWHGSLAGPSAHLHTGDDATFQYETTELQPDPTLAGSPPPHLPGFAPSWRPLATTPTSCDGDECQDPDDA